MKKIINKKLNLDKIITNDTVLFFDMDDTLIDTNLANFLSYKKAIESITEIKQSIKYNPDQRFNRSNLKNALPHLNINQYEKIVQEKEKYYTKFLPETKINQVIVEILFKYFKTNKTVLVTNCRKDRALKTLNYYELYDKFNHIFYRQNTNNKEKINKFQNAILTLGIPPLSVIAFENDESEMIDARNAGIQIINPVNL